MERPDSLERMPLIKKCALLLREDRDAHSDAAEHLCEALRESRLLQSLLDAKVAQLLRASEG